MKKVYLPVMLLCLFLLAQVAMAQDRTIEGTIMDADTNEPVIGVNVVADGTSVGTITDLDGKYSLKLPEGTTKLVYSFIGYLSQTVEIGDSDVMDLTMAVDELALGEVVVTALGISKERKALGYSVQQVTADEITKAKETNVVNALAAKVAGVQVTKSSGAPGAASFIRIRGNTSITGSNQPLFVVDGVPFDNSQAAAGNPDDGSNNLLSSVASSNRAIDLSSDDIESVSVLKGAAASALYGVDAARGVIVVTTKKGKATKGIDVSFSSSYSVDNVSNLPELQNEYAQGSYIVTTGDPNDPQYLGPETGWLASWGPRIDALEYDGDTSYDYDKNGALVPLGEGNGQRANVYDNVGSFFQTGTSLDNNVALSGGNETANFRLSFANSNTTGVVPLSTFRRTSAKLAGGIKLSSMFDIASSVTYVNSGGRRVQQGSNTSGLMLGLLRTPNTFDNSNGNTDPGAEDAYRLADGSQRNYRGGGGYDNPYWTINENPFEDDVDRVFGYAQLNFKPTDWLRASYRLGTDTYSDRRVQSFAIGSRTASAGRVANQDIFNSIINGVFNISANRQIGESLDVSAMVGHDFRTDRGSRNYAQGDGLTIPGFDHISNAGSFLVRNSNSRRERQAVFGELSFAFQRMLYLTVTGRNEWSSTLPAANNSFFYPSASLGFVFTELGPLKDNSFLPFGKIRASFAQVGNDAGIYNTKTVFTQSTFADGWTNGIAFPFIGTPGFTRGGTLGNPNLVAELTSEIEVGAELRFLRGRVGLDVAYYTKTSKDLILAVPIAASTGYRNFVANIGEMENNGFEAIVNFTPVRSKDFRWDASINFTRNRSKITKLADGIENVFLGGFEGTAVRAVEGEQYGVVYAGQWLRDDQGRVVIENNPDAAFYGFPIADSQNGVVGNPNPDWLLGFSNTINFKGFSLSALLDIKQGGQLWNGTKGALAFFGRAAVTEERGSNITFNGAYNDLYEGAVMGTTDAETGELQTNGEANNIEVLVDEDWYLNGNGSGFGSVAEHYIEDASFIRLREVTLGYTLAPKILGKTPFSSLDLGITGRNLFLSTPYTGVDPETSLTGSSNAQGLDYFQMPNTRGLTFSLRLKL